MSDKARVLCVDDEPHVLRALQWLLKKDFEVHTCERVLEAITLVRRHDFDVVVSDQRMPAMTGVELLRHVRRFAPRAMRILLTGYSDLDAMLRSVNDSEVYRFVTKPWDVRTLPRVIAEAAEAARAEPPPVMVDTSHDEAASPANDAAPPPDQREALLLIDDADDMHALADGAVGGMVDVLHAHDLDEAIRLLNSHRVAIIVSEVKVGGIDATRLLRMLKSRRPETLSLVASGHRDAETVMALINQGQVFRIVPKPVKPGFLKLLVRAALIRHGQLVATPGVRRRFAVETTVPAVEESLYRDLMAGSSAQGRHAGQEHGGLVDSLRAGWRRLLGT